MRILCFFLITTVTFSKVKIERPQDWKSHIYKATSSKTNRSYDLELIEFITKDDNDKDLLLLIPGYFQNAHSFDLIPEKEISVMRYLHRNLKMHTFVLHPNGIGKSDHVKKSNLDDIAIDDIGNAINFLKKYNKNIYIFGHSNGGITSQAYLGGLTRSARGNIFSEKIAIERQEEIKAIAISGGNVCISDSRDLKLRRNIKKISKPSRGLINNLGWINAEVMTKFLAPSGLFGKKSIAYSKIWEFLYHRDNVSKEAMKALYDKTIEGTSAKSLVQYIDAIHSDGIYSEGGDPYKRGLFNIKIPFIQMTYELDTMADPTATKKDNFDQVSSKVKEFHEFKNQGHEDWMMAEDMLVNLDVLVKFFEKN